MTALSAKEIVIRAFNAGTVVPAFNIPYLPMMGAVVRGLRDTDTFAQIQVSRPDWDKFEAGGIKAIYDEYQKVKDDAFTRLHLDHAPVIDEDDKRVDYEALVREAVELGYDSVMVDGSRLSLAENIECVKKTVAIAATTGAAVEAELGAVLGHEKGPLPPYEELFASGKGFTDPDEAKRMVDESGLDWLSVAIGNIHGAISGAAKSQKKLEARLNIEHLDRIRETVGVPLVLHGGSGIKKHCLLDAFRHGVSKINIGTAIRQPYEQHIGEGVEAAQQAVYETVVFLVREELEIAGSASVINPMV